MENRDFFSIIRHVSLPGHLQQTSVASLPALPEGFMVAPGRRLAGMAVCFLEKQPGISWE